ncbi:MAG: translation initiation factor IF-2 N-terminal domain-containing protein, partial [Rubrobacter sp.]|nr:translation initiation factor IF-2 N-terminal domain-containing protein [Rubrobacter sp.]
MSKRVYEIARERSLETKEVMDRLRDAGVEVKNHFAVVDDPVVDG